MYFPFWELHRWGKFMLSSRRRLIQSFPDIGWQGAFQLPCQPSFVYFTAADSSWRITFSVSASNR